VDPYSLRVNLVLNSNYILGDLPFQIHVVKPAREVPVPVLVVPRLGDENLAPLNTRPLQGRQAECKLVHYGPLVQALNHSTEALSIMYVYVSSESDAKLIVSNTASTRRELAFAHQSLQSVASYSM
jgi:hypothetical protein